MQQPVDLVTVSYNQEIRLLQMQARSIARYADPAFVGTIYVISNEKRFRHFKRLFLRDVLPEYGAFAPRVKLLDHRDIIPKTLETTGWESQQVYKLKIADMLESPVYLVLDSKNLFIAPVSFETFFLEDGRLGIMRGQMNEKLGKLFDNACALFGVTPSPECYELALPMATPYPMVAAEVRSMMRFMEEARQADFFTAFIEGQLYCEFYTYYAWLLKEGKLDSLYERQWAINLTLWNKEFIAREGMPAILDKLGLERTRMMGIHRKFLRDGTAEQKKQVGDFWMSRGLLSSSDEHVYFLSEPEDERAGFLQLVGKLGKPYRRWKRKRQRQKAL